MITNSVIILSLMSPSKVNIAAFCTTLFVNYIKEKSGWIQWANCFIFCVYKWLVEVHFMITTTDKWNELMMRKTVDSK